ncbi:uncharacterized protein LOC135208399 [Macrobrachium nipponense]|uniref:uncharacterized protein LOC135208399 n=1 Tax=Macrobrachium nipponense TaxID=159736 RepID=UPI0030C8B1D2
MKVLGLLLLLALSSTSQVLEGQDPLENHDDPVHPVLLRLTIPPFNVNSFIDSLLVKLSNDIPSAAKIKDIHSKYAYGCTLYYDKGVQRVGDAVFEVKGNQIFFGFGLSTNRITVKCRWSKRFLFVKLKGTVKASTDRVSVRARVVMNLSETPKATLLEFKVTELAPIKTGVTGLWIANSFAEKYLNKKVNGARDKIINQLESSVSTSLQKELDKLKLPFSLDG